MPIRSYQAHDYDRLKELYQHSEWYGGVFDESRNGRDTLARKIASDPEVILVYEIDSVLVGTISLIEDGRVAWLYRFVVKEHDPDITKQLYEKAIEILKQRGHDQVLVYSDPKNQILDERYEKLGMTKGGTYTCFWAEIQP